MKVFLGGSCQTDWREAYIKFLAMEKIEYFNPVVEDWNKECRQEEEIQKKKCDKLLWVLTPNMKGFYSFFEIGELSIQSPKKLIVVVEWKHLDPEQFRPSFHVWSPSQVHCIEAMKENLAAKGIPVFDSCHSSYNYLRKLNKWVKCV